MFSIPLTTTELILAILILVVAYVVRGITSFGSGLIAIPLLALMLPITAAVPLVGLLDFTASIVHVSKHRKNIVWSETLGLIPFTLVGVTTGLVILHHVNLLYLSRAMGAFAVAYAVYSFVGVQPRGGGSKWWRVPTGFIGGVASSIFGTGGPFYIIYLQLRGMAKLPFRATTATIFLLDGCSRIIGYSIGGIYTESTILMTLMAMPVMFIALYVGGHIHTSISQKMFRNAISVTLIGSGLALLLR